MNRLLSKKKKKAMISAGQIAEALYALGTPRTVYVRANQQSGVVTLVFPTDMVQADRDAAQTALASLDLSDAGEAARQVIQNRIDAPTMFLNSTPLGQILRAEALVLIDEINILRAWITSFKVATAAATSLADLKTRVAALDSVPQRTAAQAKSAITSKAGDVQADA